MAPGLLKLAVERWNVVVRGVGGEVPFLTRRGENIPSGVRAQFRVRRALSPGREAAIETAWKDAAICDDQSVG